MSYQTMEYRASRSERAMKPVLGAVAVMAALATLGLAIVAPAALSSQDPSALASAKDRPTEVAISPASIHIVVHRVKTAQSGVPLVPTAYKQGG